MSKIIDTDGIYPRNKCPFCGSRNWYKKKSSDLITCKRCGGDYATENEIGTFNA
jgi:DNA-directed RNA polymerase subunit RPC12/RpoP